MIVKQQEISIGVIVIIFGIFISYFVFNMILSTTINDVSFHNLGTKASSELADPDVDVFNYHAINPTVEVNVGSNSTTTSSEPEPEPEPESESEPESEPESEFE